MALISDETLFRLSLYILFMGYLEDGAFRFTEVTEYDNIDCDRKIVEDEDSKEDNKEAVTNSEEEASKKRAQRKVKRDAAQAQTLLLTTVLGSSAPASASVLVLRLFVAVPR